MKENEFIGNQSILGVFVFIVFAQSFCVLFTKCKFTTSFKQEQIKTYNCNKARHLVELGIIHANHVHTSA